MLALLILYAKHIGLEVTFGRGYASQEANEADGGHTKSLHLSRLAQDLNVFKDEMYLKDDEAAKAHNKLHDYWDLIGGAERILRDLNHYSRAHGGMT